MGAPARIDAHQHFWDLASGGYDWPTPAEAPIYRTFGPEDLASEISAAGIDATVLVQTTNTLSDTDAMIRAKDANGWIAGIVGWVPMEDVAAAAAALQPRLERGVRGIRHLIHREPDPDWVTRRDVGATLSYLESIGLPFDVVAVFPHHLRHITDLADRHPRLTFVIDHLAKPPIRRDAWGRWRIELEAAALRPNVVAKISGLDTAAGTGWTIAEIQPSVDVAIAAFGPERLLFGSDWPVCRLASTYAEVAAASRAWVGALSTSEQDQILGGNAARVYRL